MGNLKFNEKMEQYLNSPDLWKLSEDGKFAIRNGKQFPIDKEYLEQIKKQTVAAANLINVINLEEADEKLIGKLWAFLSTYADYLGIDAKKDLSDKMKQISKSDYIELDNSQSIEKMANQLQNDMENLEVTLDEFYENNLDNIRKMATIEEAKGHQL